MRKSIATAFFLACLLAAALLGWWRMTSDTSSTPRAADAPAPAADTDAPALPRGSISGHVRRTDGAPISGATVTATATDAETATATTDAQGAYLLEDVGGDTWRLDAAAQGYISPGPEDVRGLSVQLPAPTSPPLTDQDMTLRRPASVTGRILARGRPVSGTRISLYYLHADGIGGPLDPFALDGAATSGADGTYTLDGIAPGRLRLLVEAQGWALAESEEVLLTEGEALTDLDIDLATSSPLKLTVVDTQGNPVRAEVVLSAPEMRSRRLRVPADGELLIPDLPRATITVTASATGFAREEATVTTSEEEVTSVDLVMTPTQGLLGRVVTSADVPPERTIPVVLRAESGEVKVVRTDAEGTFTYNPPEESTGWSATATSPHHANPSPTALRRGEEVTLTLGGPGAISGRVVTQNGQPIPSFQIAVEDFEVEGPRAFNQRTWDPVEVRRPDGSFTFGPLTPGTYYLRAQPEGYASAISERIEVREGATTRNIRITVEAAGAITGVVRTTAGDPLEGARVEVFAPQSPFPAQQTRTDAQGRYALSGVSPGRQSVRTSRKGYTTQIAAGVDVPAGGEAVRDVVMEKAEGRARFSFHGIGATLGKEGDGVVIRDMMEGSPSQVFGLKEGDRILGIDGESARQMRLTEVVNRIRGREGVPVSLEVERAGEGRVTIEVERGRVTVK